MQDEKTKYRHWDLPDSFWQDLIQVRDYLISDRPFRDFVYGLRIERDPLAKAFLHLDVWIDSWIQITDENENELVDY